MLRFKDFFSKKWAFFIQKTDLFCQKIDRNLGFQEKRQLLPKIGENRRKLVKIAENW
jgi:hypothetical protein